MLDQIARREFAGAKRRLRSGESLSTYDPLSGGKNRLFAAGLHRLMFIGSLRHGWQSLAG
jgi:hypothetical protein